METDGRGRSNMKKIELGSALFLSVLLGVLIVFGRSLIDSLGSNSMNYDTMEDPIGQATATPGRTPPFPIRAASEDASPKAFSTLPSIEVGVQKGEDIADVLLLYDPSDPTNFDSNFCQVAVYYALLCQRLDLEKTELSDDDLRDSQGAYFKLIGISAGVMQPAFFNDDELDILGAAVETGDVNLFVSKLNVGHGITTTAKLTRNAILGVEVPTDSRRDWLVATTASEITREFTGQTISPTGTFPQADFAIVSGEEEQTTPLITSTDDNDMTYPIFVRWRHGNGEVFVDAGMDGKNISDLSLTELYFDQNDFTQIIPRMFAMRYSLGQEVWHNDRNYADLTIDDPPLMSSETSWKEYMDYDLLLLEMEQHNFHTIIAFVPKNWEKSESDIVRLFLENPDRYSLVQHGNNADGFEFYKYTVSDDDEWPARSLAEQERDIVEGLSRMWRHTYQTGLPFDQIMIFPYGNAPAPTLKIIKERNYLAAARRANKPLDAPDPDSLGSLMLPASFDYENFSVVKRYWIQTWDPDGEEYDPLIPVYQLFLDRPALLFSHHG